MIESSTLKFLRSLEANNNREWFQDHKSEYNKAKSNVEDLVMALENELNKTDKIEAHKLYRIYRDVRFSNDKTPYKSWFSGYFKRSGAERRGGYYFSIQPEGTVIGGGFYGPNKEDLLRIRKEFEADGNTIESIVKDPRFIKHFNQMEGSEVSTAPKGFQRDHPNIKWIRKKQLYAFEHFSDSEVTSKNFVQDAAKSFKAIRPFFDYMSDVLTTNLNGESVLK